MPKEAPPPVAGQQHEHHILVEEDTDDWAWRRALRSNPATRTAYRVTVFVLGLLIVLLGLALVPLPGPGWLVVIFGVAVWSSEFEFAQRVLHWLKAQLKRWTSWTAAQPWWIKGLVGLATLLFVLCVFWVLLRLSGIPELTPDPIEQWLRVHLWL